MEHICYCYINNFNYFYFLKLKQDPQPLLKKENLIPLIFFAFFCLFPPIIFHWLSRGASVKYTDGSKFYVRAENIYCKWRGEEDNRRLYCTASGVRTYLNGARENYSDERFCSRTEYGKEANPKDWWSNPGPNTFVCRTARKFGKY